MANSKLPRMYTKKDSDKSQIRLADESSIDSGDPMNEDAYVKHEYIGPNLKTKKLRKKGAPDAAKSAK